MIDALWDVDLADVPNISNDDDGALLPLTCFPAIDTGTCTATPGNVEGGIKGPRNLEIRHYTEDTPTERTCADISIEEDVLNRSTACKG